MSEFWNNALHAGAIDFLRLWFSPASRSFWLFMAPSLLVAFWFWRRDRARERSLPARFRTFSAATWFSRSAINDYGLVVLNAMLIGTLLAPLTLNAETVRALVQSLLDGWTHGLGSDPQWWAPVLLALTLFLVDDFMRYALHYGEHRLQPLWELHKVHHSAEVLNFVTAERHHPLSSIYFRTGVALAIGATNGVFFSVFGDQLTPWTLLGANGFWILANMLCSTLRHSPCWLSFGPRIEKWLISPAQHQIHHSTDPKHFGKNLGGTLAIWDRLFGTLHVTGPEREVTCFGLGEENAHYQSFFSLYVRPLALAARSLAPSSLSPSR